MKPLVRFSAVSMVPNLGLAVLSWWIARDVRFAATGTVLVLAILAATTYILLKGIDAKRQGAEFDE